MKTNIHLVKDEVVNIYQLPAINIQYTLDTPDVNPELTIGDLHANTMKLIYFLVRNGIFTNLDSDDYDRLVTIYCKESVELKKNDIEDFKQIINNIAISNKPKIRLIGDELCDRGQNDYFTLLVLQKLGEAGVPIEILLSNHSNEFIYAYETGQVFKSSILYEGHSKSMRGLQTIIDNQLVSRDEVINIINTHYKKNLRALSYSLISAHRIALYSHAPIDARVVKPLAKKLSVKYKEDSATKLAETIDDINKSIASLAQNNTLNTLYDVMTIYKAYHSKKSLINYKKHPHEFIIWNRNYLKLKSQHDFLKKHISIDYVHGHHKRLDEPPENVKGLDNDLGKGLAINAGELSYLICYAKPKPTANCEVDTTKNSKHHFGDFNLFAKKLKNKLPKGTNNYSNAADHNKRKQVSAYIKERLKSDIHSKKSSDYQLLHALNSLFKDDSTSLADYNSVKEAVYTYSDNDALQFNTRDFVKAILSADSLDDLVHWINDNSSNDDHICRA